MQGALLSIIEVMAITTFVFLVAAELPASLTLLLLNGVFAFQIFIDFCYSKPCCCCSQSCSQCMRRNYTPMAGNNEQAERPRPYRVEKLKKVRQIINFFETLLENKTVKVFAFFLQIGGIMILIPTWVVLMGHPNTYKLRPMVGLPLSLLVLSFIWSNKVQEWIAKADNTVFTDQKRTARYKSSMLTFTVDKI